MIRRVVFAITVKAVAENGASAGDPHVFGVLEIQNTAAKLAVAVVAVGGGHFVIRMAVYVGVQRGGRGNKESEIAGQRYLTGAEGAVFQQHRAAGAGSSIHCFVDGGGIIGFPIPHRAVIAHIKHRLLRHQVTRQRGAVVYFYLIDIQRVRLLGCKRKLRYRFHRFGKSGAAIPPRTVHIHIVSAGISVHHQLDQIPVVRSIIVVRHLLIA